MEKFELENIGLKLAAEDQQEFHFSGILFKFTEEIIRGTYVFKNEAFAKSGNKIISMFYMHNNNSIPIGSMKTELNDDGLYVNGKFNLEDENARKLYTLMKEHKVPFELSAGLYFEKRKYNEEKDVYEVHSVDIFEGSIVDRGQIKGSKVKNVFSLENINTKNNGGNTMAEKTNLEIKVEQLLEKFGVQDNTEIAKLREENIVLKTEFGKLKEDSEKYKDLVAKFEANNEKLAAAEDKINEMLRNSTFATAVTPEQSEIQLEKHLKTEFTKFLTGTKEIRLANITGGGNTGNLDNATNPVFANNIIKRTLESSGLFTKARKVKMNAFESMAFPRLASGFLQVSRVAEGSARGNTSILQVETAIIKTHAIYSNFQLTNEMIKKQSYDYVALMKDNAVAAVDFTVSKETLTGAGDTASECFGILQDVDVKQKTIAQADVATVFDATFIMGAYADMKKDSRKAEIFMSQVTYDWLRNKKAPDGHYKEFKFGPMTAPTIDGVKVVYDDAFPDYFGGTAPVGDCLAMVADMDGYTIGYCDEMAFIQDQLTQKGYHTFYQEMYFGGNVTNPDKFRPIVVSATL